MHVDDLVIKGCKSKVRIWIGSAALLFVALQTFMNSGTVALEMALASLGMMLFFPSIVCGKRFDLIITSHAVSGPGAGESAKWGRVTIPLNNIDLSSLPEVSSISAINNKALSIKSTKGDVIHMAPLVHTLDDIRRFVAAVRGCIA